MPGFLLHKGAVVNCVHGGQAQPTAFSPRVTVSGQPIVVKANPYAITGCTLPALSSGVSPPCVTAQWVTSSLRVKSMGVPVLLMDSQATCVPTGTPLLISTVQPRVSAM